MKFGSTQDYIREKTVADAKGEERPLPNGVVVIAESQTKGKGTNGRKWLANPRRQLNFFTFT